MPRIQHVTYSIFGQIEAVVAEAMIGEGKAHKLPSDAPLPATVATNDRGDPARFAIMMPKHNVAEFERRIANLYA